MFEEYVIPAEQFYLAIIAPAFQDLIPTTGNFTSVLAEFTIMNKVKSKAPIIDIRRKKNILQRRDASCDLNYKKLMGTTTRLISVEELYAAVKHCANEFYQGALRDWRRGDKLFGTKILPFFREAVTTDIVTNAFFGDTMRPEVNGAEYSTTKFDGLFKWCLSYAAYGVIPANQTIAIPRTNFDTNPLAAFGLFKSAEERQPVLMRNFAAGDKMYVVDRATNAGYQAYLRTIGEESSWIVERYANGVQVQSYLGIRIYVEPTWEPVLAELYGSNAHALILTIRGNFIFATDDEYGEGENLDEALMIWYERKELSWYYQQFLKAGVQLALPEFVVFGLPED